MSRPVRYTKEVLEAAVKANVTWSGVQRTLRGKVTSGGTQGHLKNLAKRWSIAFSHFTGRSWNKGVPSGKKKKPADFLKDHGDNRLKPPNSCMLKRSLQEIGIAYACSLNCGVTDTWNGRHIVLQVDHINGNRFDCRAENLRFLCPNCHTQTETWGNKNQDRLPPKAYECTSCGKKVTRQATKCQSCAQRSRTDARTNGRYDIGWPPLTEMLSMASAMNLSEIGRRLKCSGNAVRAHFRKFGVENIPRPQIVETHGTEWRYRQKKCRCDLCVEEHRRRRRKPLLSDSEPHTEEP